MADKNSARSQGTKKKDKKAENKTPEEKKKDKKAENKTPEEKKNKDKTKEKAPKKVEKIPEQPQAEAEDGGGGGGGGEAAGGAEVTDGDFQPIELPPFEIVTGWVSKPPPFSTSPWLSALLVW